MLAYSSIAQAGFMLFALFSLNDYANKGLLMYSVAYSLATIGLFAVLVKMKDVTFEGYNGLAKLSLYWRQRVPCFCFLLRAFRLPQDFLQNIICLPL